MKPSVAQFVVGGLLLLVLTLPILWAPDSSIDESTTGDVLKLVVISPHNEQIRYETEVAFSKWHQKNHGQPVQIDWRVIGGTSDIERQLISEYTALDQQNRIDDGAGYDVVFGGGDYSFDRKLKPAVGGQVLAPLSFSDEFIRDVYPSAMVADKKLYDPEGMWWGVVLSSFGIVFNREVTELLGLSEPERWQDLTDPKLDGWVGMADPTHSGSVRVTYDAILQHYGWLRGWATLRRASANARYFASSSAKVPLDVSAGEAAMGMCIDFYGNYQASVVGGGGGGSASDVWRVGYVAPVGETVVTADPVGVLRGAPRRELAERFVRFLLSEDTQGIWMYRLGEDGGPERFELRRPPVRRDMYTAAKRAKMADDSDPFEIASAVAAGTPSYFGALVPVMRAMAMDRHDELKDAWRTLYGEKDAVRRAEMERLFDAMPFSESELQEAMATWKTDPAARSRDRLAWGKFFSAKYRQIIEIGKM